MSKDDEAHRRRLSGKLPNAFECRGVGSLQVIGQWEEGACRHRSATPEAAAPTRKREVTPDSTRDGTIGANLRGGLYLALVIACFPYMKRY